jgi:hypothetical protein
MRTNNNYEEVRTVLVCGQYYHYVIVIRRRHVEAKRRTLIDNLVQRAQREPYVYRYRYPVSYR